MIGLIILCMLINILMLISVIMFESSSKKIIFWALIISLTSFLGYIVYLIFFSDKGFIKKTMLKKEKEDKIYLRLAGYRVSNATANSDIMNYTKKAYDVNHYQNSDMKILDNNEIFSSDLLGALERAEKSILIDTSVFLGNLPQEMVTSLLCDKHKMGVLVKVVYSKLKFRDRDYLNDLKNAGVRVYKFNKFSTNNRYYNNNKNLIIIDDKIAYLSSQNRNSKNISQVESTDLYYKFEGDIVREIDLQAHMDITFASKKFLPMSSETRSNDVKNDIEFSYIASTISNNLLDLLLKAIISAKHSIILHFDKFIPNESIIEAIKLAVKSDVKVKIMISNLNRQYGYYTSRSYVKELACEGVSCYFFDGHINSNYIVIDDETIMFGSLSMVNQSLLCDLQDIMIVSSKSHADGFVKRFNEAINNSYKLNNPKRVLFREKFFRKFM